MHVVYLSSYCALQPTDLMSTASIYQTGTTNQSTFGGPFTRSVFSQSQSERSTTSMAGADDLEHHENVGSTAGKQNIEGNKFGFGSGNQ